MAGMFYLTAGASCVLFLASILSPSAATIFQHFVAEDVPATSKCPIMTDAPMTQVVDTHVVPLEAESTGCQQILECNTLTSPPETIVYWYRNGEMIQANAVRDATLRVGGLLEDPILGLTSIRHRICSDNHALPGEKNAFVCRAQSACNAHNVAEGAPIVVEGPVNKRINSTTERAPMITYATTTRMELAGNFVQMSCRTDATPQPNIDWFVVDPQDESLLLPVKHFAALWKLTDWDVIVDSSKLQDASLTLQCTVSNKHGSDSAKLTLVLLDGL